MKRECEDQAKPKKKTNRVSRAACIHCLSHCRIFLNSLLLLLIFRRMLVCVCFLNFLCYFSATWMRIASMQRDISNNGNLNRTFFHLALLGAGFCFFWFFFLSFSQLAAARNDKFYFGYSFGLRSFFHSVPFSFSISFYFIRFLPFFLAFILCHFRDIISLSFFLSLCVWMCRFSTQQ